MSPRPGTGDSPGERTPQFGVAWCLALAVVVLIFARQALTAQLVFSDWHAYYRAAANLLGGADIYSEAKELLARNSYDYWVHTDGHYVYPPLLALLVAPIATVLDIGKGGDLWVLILVVATAAFLWVATRLHGCPMRLETLTPLALPVLTSVPLLLGLRYGQVDIILLLLAALALLAYLGGRDVLAGVALGLAAAVKPTLALYGLFFLRKRRWRTLVAATITGATLGLGPFLWFGQVALSDWISVARYFSGEDYPSYPSNQSWRGLMLRAFAGGPRHVALLDVPLLAESLWLLGVGAALALFWRCTAGTTTTGPRALAEFSLLVALVLFAAPLSEDIHYVMLMLPLVVLVGVATWPAGRHAAWWLVLVAAGCLYFMQPWLDFAYNRGSIDLRRLVASGVYIYGLVLVIAALVSLLWRRTPRTDATGAGSERTT